MATRSIVGRFLILAILLVAVGIVAQAAMILTGGGKKPVKTASAAPATTPTPADPADTPAGAPVRVVYPGPLGDTAIQKPKLADSASASPLAAPAPQTTAKLAQAMAGTAETPTAAAASPVPSTVPASQPASAAGTDASSAAAAASDPAPAAAAAPTQTAVATTAPATTAVAPTGPAPAGVEVASLGGGAPAAEAPSTGGVNINTASVEALNHLGGGHIGESIAKHRPYSSVGDLVKKRVLRRSVFDQIRGQIAAK